MTDITALIAELRFEAKRDPNGSAMDAMLDAADALEARQARAEAAEAEADRLRVLWDKSGKNDLIARAEAAEAERQEAVEGWYAADQRNEGLHARIAEALAMLGLFRAWNVTPEQIDNLARILSAPAVPAEPEKEN